MLVLGINAYHPDASACLLADGQLVTAAEEERFQRVRHWAGFPGEAIRYCLSEAGASIADVGPVAINQHAGANLVRKIAYTLVNWPDIGLILARVRRRRAGVDEALRALFPGEQFRAKVHAIEHHLAHLGSAFLVSPFEEAVAVSVDGFGDFASAAWGVGSRDGSIEVGGKVFFPHSLGIFYQALTQYLGFPDYGDEYKVMGLAPYGAPRFMAEMRQIVSLEAVGTFRLNLEYFRHHRERISYECEGGEPVFADLYSSALEALLGPARGKGGELTQRHRDIARSVQAMYEEAFFHLLESLHARYKLDAVVLAGGCAMNSVANGKVLARSPFKRLYVQSAAGDAGGAIGAAFVVWHKESVGKGLPTYGSSPLLRGEPVPVGRFVMDHAYWGPGFSNEAIGEVLAGAQARIEEQGCSVERVADEGELCARTAAAIAEGKVVGWFQGRMEWGPRALGNRSIVCDPRRADMKDMLNLKIKRRESFRPFAPSIRREAVPEWFEVDDDVPFMMQVYPIREEKRAQIPAVTHVDGSGRLQTVYRETSPRYYRLIEAFAGLTGVPMVLNTSFNENEPVVCKPEEALDCFLRTKMDVLVMGDWVVERDSVR